MKIELLKKKYPSGTKVKCIQMNDPSGVPAGTQGTVKFVDDMGTIHVGWENGSSLGLVFGVDQFEILNENKMEYEIQDVAIDINVSLIHKDYLVPKPHHIEKAIKLGETEFYNLLEAPLDDKPFISDNIEQMFQNEDGSFNSILVYTDNYPDGVVIESEGYSYARYQGYVSNVHELLETGIVKRDNEYIKHNKIKILVVEPNAKPYVAIIDNDYESIRNMVGGILETVTLSKSAGIVCNEEGKLIGLQANRRFRNDVLVGRFIIVGYDDSDQFVSLSQSDINLYSQQFNEIEMINQQEVLDSIRYEILY